jgi:hypothetical protein
MPPIFNRTTTAAVPTGRRSLVGESAPMTDARRTTAATKALVVRSVSMHKLRHDRVQINVRFSQDVGDSLDASDLTLVDKNGQVATPTSVTLQYDAETHTAKWTVDGLDRGRYQVKLSGASVADAQGQTLDGDRDGSAGGDFTTHRRLRINKVA